MKSVYNYVYYILITEGFMLSRPSIEPNQQDKMEITDEHQKNGSQQHSVQLTDLPDEILLMINDRLPSVKDTAHLASVSFYFHRLFQPEIEKKEAEDAAKCAIYPTKENVEKLKASLKACPALLLHKVTVKNRHNMPIKGTVYQIALHEGDDELISDVIKRAFMKLDHGLEAMETQRQAWLPEGWMEAEERACVRALIAIDHVFTAFKNASNPNDVTELQQRPFTITINHQGAKETLEAFRKAIDLLYKPTDKVIESGRDPIIRLLERVTNRYGENYEALGEYNTPRNNVLMRAVFGYCQRFAPINFMQAFAQVIFDILENNKKLTRSFEYSNWKNNFILPFDSNLQFRLGYEFFGDDGQASYVSAWLRWGGERGAGRGAAFYKAFFQ